VLLVASSTVTRKLSGVFVHFSCTSSTKTSTLIFVEEYGEDAEVFDGDRIIADNLCHVARA
jgi:hypothetical protein